jgi:predicted transcriptional regulator
MIHFLKVTIGRHNMPAVSFYLPDDVLSHLKAEAKACKKSVSCMIREAVVGHLEKEQKGKAKTQFLRLLRGADLGTWEGVHAERQRAEIGRS